MASIRLLHRLPDGEIVFCEPTSLDDAPAYAILSHTWGKEEVLFLDMEPGADRSKTMGKAGWHKIQFCAEQARKDGLQYFWVDTCCIDKRNAVELGAAINSMFRWYQDAARCYVYLEDVSKPDVETADDSVWKGQFRQSRWFSRGWTLQELIAPLNVRFFSKEGNALGRKSSLEQDIYEVTEIPILAFQRSRLSEFDTDQRMSWAVKRKTTIEEDQVYCLMGLLEVFILPIYGEGKANALWRLQDAIERRSQSLGSKRLLGPQDPSPPSKPKEIGASDRDGEANRNVISGEKRPDAKTVRSGNSIPTHSNGSLRSLPSLQPVLAIPSKTIGVLIGRLSQDKQMEIADFIAYICKTAAVQFVFKFKLLPDDEREFLRLKLAEYWLSDVLACWMSMFRERLIKYHGWQNLRERFKLAEVIGGHTKGGEAFDDPFNIPKMSDAKGNLDAREFERSLCCAIVWCRELQSVAGEHYLALLWTDLHPSNIDEKWTINTDNLLSGFVFSVSRTSVSRTSVSRTDC